MPKLIVCITGMPGSGKTTVAKALEGLGFRLLSMGDAVRAEAKRTGLSMTSKTMNDLMVSLRKEKGPDAVAKLCLPILKSKEHEFMAIDGARNMQEVKVFKGIGRVKLLSVHAPMEERYLHLKERGRADAPSRISEFHRRDLKELEVGVGNAMAMADRVISNAGITVDELKRKAVRVVSSWVKELERG